MSKWNMDPEVVYLNGGSIEVHPAEHVRLRRKPDGSMEQSDPLHVQANVRVFLHGEDGFFAFSMTPAQASALAASVDRHCPDADPEDMAITGGSVSEPSLRPDTCDWLKSHPELAPHAAPSWRLTATCACEHLCMVLLCDGCKDAAEAWHPGRGLHCPSCLRLPEGRHLCRVSDVAVAPLEAGTSVFLSGQEVTVLPGADDG